jgi:hypothetical protein
MPQTNPETLPRRTVGEWTLTSERTYKEPFVDVTVDVTFHAPSGQALTIPAFYDGDGIWRVRFNPGEPGQWTFQAHTRPADASLMRRGEFTVTERAADGFLKATPGDAFGFRFESGKPLFIVGDTTYNLFGAAHCDLPVDAFMERRAAQGFNLLRDVP